MRTIQILDANNKPFNGDYQTLMPSLSNNMGMIQLSKTMFTETGHRLLNYDGKCAHLHGHSWQWEVSVVSFVHEIGPDGLLLDYKVLKRIMKIVLDPLDHCMLLNVEDPMLPYFGSQLEEALAGSNGESGRVILCEFNPTSENLSIYVVQQMMEHFKNLGLDGLNVRVACKETVSSSCSYY